MYHIGMIRYCIVAYRAKNKLKTGHNHFSLKKIERGLALVFVGK
jgi:hypothetical protein